MKDSQYRHLLAVLFLIGSEMCGDVFLRYSWAACAAMLFFGGVAAAIREESEAPHANP